MDREQVRDGCGIFIALIAVLAGSFFAGRDAGRRDGRDAERRDAIVAGVARYVADPATGEVRFEYLAPCGASRRPARSGD